MKSIADSCIAATARECFALTFAPHSRARLIYYEDFDDDEMQTITLQQWRQWRYKPEFNNPHRWVKGKFVLVKDVKSKHQ